MHAEMPRQDGSTTIGMQLWVDLPEKLKKCEPRYRDLRASEIPNIDIDDGKVHIKIISGQSHGVDSVQELAYTPVWIFDIEIRPGGKIVQNLPEGWNAFAYTLNGSTAFGIGNEQVTVGKFHNVVFEQKGDEVYAEVAKDTTENGRFSKSPNLVYSVARYGKNVGFSMKLLTVQMMLAWVICRLSFPCSTLFTHKYSSLRLVLYPPIARLWALLYAFEESVCIHTYSKGLTRKRETSLSATPKRYKKICVRRESNPGPIEECLSKETVTRQDDM